MHLDPGKRMHKCNLKVNMSKIQGNRGIKMRVEAYSRLLELYSTVRYLTLYLFCIVNAMCAMCPGADLQICEKHLFIIRWLQVMYCHTRRWSQLPLPPPYLQVTVSVNNISALQCSNSTN